MLHRDGNPAYLDTVNRIWRCRVRHKDVSGERSLLLLPELERWRSDIEASLLDSQCPTEIEKCTAASEEVHPSTAAEEVHPSTAAEVQKVRRECDSVELQYLSKDSLLNSLEVNETPIEEQSRDADVPCPHVINNNDPDLMEKDLTSVPRNDYHRPSLMERNSTTPISEWNDSIDGLEGGTSDHAIRCHLPSPKGTKVSPLTKYKPTKITRSRKTKRWSQLEEETRKTAVDKFGRGKWKLMLDSNKDIFKERTEVDLNDKWRSMTRYGCK
ncbi:hypothetical protein GmHk_08G021370 [Glycine max]|nr:hypothetical protein GmHk_08G021370 [Glycine max]